MATSEEKTELVETIKGPRFYRIMLWGYGGESEYMELTKEQYDFVIANGLFTQKFNFTQNQMLRFFTECILKLNKISRKGFLFNILSENIDFKNPKNFYLNKREVNNILDRQYYTNMENISKTELFETFYMIQK